MALSDKHKKFVDEYMKDMNATAAYLRAGYKCSEASARVNASKLLTNPNIASEISDRVSKRQQKIQENTEISVEWVLKELADNHSKAKAIGDIGPSNKALELIGKHLGMFKDKLEISGETGVKIINDIPRPKR